MYCRYVSSSEAVWRILKFPLCYRSTAVEKLSFHLPGKKPVIFKDDDKIVDVFDKKAQEDSMMMAWFNLNKVDEFARTLTYSQIPQYYTYNKQKKQFKRRVRGFALGRINYVPRQCEDGYFLRILLNIVKGPKSFDDLKKYQEVVYESFKDACEARGILEDEQAYIDTIVESSLWSFGDELCNIFARTLLSNLPSRPETIWEATKSILSEDMQHKMREKFKNPG